MPEWVKMGQDSSSKAKKTVLGYKSSMAFFFKFLREKGKENKNFDELFDFKSFTEEKKQEFVLNALNFVPS